MKGHVTRGAGFRGLLNYNLGAGKTAGRGRIVGGNMSGDTPRALAVEFSAARKLRPDCKRPVWHCSLSLPAGDDLADDRFNQVARQHLTNMGLDPDSRPWILIRHSDTPHSHAHIVTSRIGLDGSLWHGQHEALKVIESTQQLEKQFNLTLTPGLDSKEPGVRVSRDQLEAAARKGTAPHRHPKLQIAARLDEALARSSSLDQLQAEAQKLGVEVRYAANSGGIYGVSFKLADDQKAPWLKGSQVGKSYTATSLLRRIAGDADTPRDRVGPRVRQDILDRMARERQGDREVIRWASGHVAAVATENEIRFHSSSEATARVCAALARERGWATMELADRGSQEKNEAAIKAYHQAGIEVLLNGKRHPAPAKDERNDARDPRPGAAGGRTPAASAGAAGPAASHDRGNASPTQHPAIPGQTLAAAATAAAADAGTAGRTARPLDEARPVVDASKQANPKGKKNMDDALAFLNASPEEPAPATAALVAPKPKPQPPKPAGPVATADDHNKATAAALAREMARRRWATSEAVEIELAASRDALAWLEAQSLARRTLARATGEHSRLVGEIEALGAAHRQALDRESGLAKHLAADPLGLIQEEAQASARQRADLKADAARILAEREAKAEAQRQQAAQRDRERQAQQDKDDQPIKRKKSSGPAAPKPR